MNLTVAVKIIGGFTIIAILLVVTSVSSLLNLNKINDSTTKVSDLAIPTLVNSNKLALQLTQMGGFTLRGYYQEELAPLATNESDFNSINDSFSKELKILKSIVQNEGTLLGNLKKLTVYTNRLLIMLKVCLKAVKPASNK